MLDLVGDARAVDTEGRHRRQFFLGEGALGVAGMIPPDEPAVKIEGR